MTLYMLISSAGVGRSGTFIVVDSMLARIQHEQTIDIYNYVRYLRTRRMFMVQTEVKISPCFCIQKYYHILIILSLNLFIYLLLYVQFSRRIYIGRRQQGYDTLAKVTHHN